MNTFTTPSAVKNQYATASNLNTRISLHDKYSVNKQGFGNWITEHYPIRTGMRVLELGCGTGGYHEQVLQPHGPWRTDCPEGVRPFPV